MYTAVQPRATAVRPEGMYFAHLLPPGRASNIRRQPATMARCPAEAGSAYP